MINWIDLIIIAVVALSMITGLIRGFVKELIALCVWVLAFWLAFNYSQQFDPLLQNYIQNKTARIATGFIIILIGTLIAGAIVNTLLGFVLRRSGLSGTDRILGVGFGLVRGVFIVALLMVVIKLTSLPADDYAKQSKLYSQFNPIVDWLYSIKPEFIKKTNLFEQNPNFKSEFEKILPTVSLADPNDYELSEG